MANGRSRNHDLVCTSIEGREGALPLRSSRADTRVSHSRQETATLGDRFVPHAGDDDRPALLQRSEACLGRSPTLPTFDQQKTSFSPLRARGARSDGGVARSA